MQLAPLQLENVGVLTNYSFAGGGVGRSPAGWGGIPNASINCCFVTPSFAAALFKF